MKALFRKKARVMALFSLAFLTQCCCCILPVGWEVQRRDPDAWANRIEMTINDLRGEITDAVSWVRWEQ